MSTSPRPGVVLPNPERTHDELVERHFSQLKTVLEGGTRIGAVQHITVIVDGESRNIPLDSLTIRPDFTNSIVVDLSVTLSRVRPNFPDGYTGTRFWNTEWYARIVITREYDRQTADGSVRTSKAHVTIRVKNAREEGSER